jgi:hypothetical protein
LSRRRRKSRNKEEGPEDPIDKAFTDILRVERQSEEISRSQYGQEVIEMKREELRRARKEPQEDFFTGMTNVETNRLSEELSVGKIPLFILIGNLVYRSKKLTPKELREEIAALVKGVPFRDPAENLKFYSEGIRIGSKIQAIIDKAMVEKASGEEMSKRAAEVIKMMVEKYESLNRAAIPMMLALEQTSGSTSAGSSITVPVGVLSCTEPVEFFTRDHPKDMAEHWVANPAASPTLILTGQLTFELAPTTLAGAYEMTVVAKDAEGRTATAPYTLTVVSPAPPA